MGETNLFNFCIFLKSFLILRAKRHVILKRILHVNLITEKTSSGCDHIDRRRFLLFNWNSKIDIQGSLKQRLLLLIININLFIIFLDMFHASCIFFLGMNGLIWLIQMVTAHFDWAKLYSLFLIYQCCISIIVILGWEIFLKF